VDKRDDRHHPPFFALFHPKHPNTKKKNLFVCEGSGALFPCYHQKYCNSDHDPRKRTPNFVSFLLLLCLLLFFPSKIPFLIPINMKALLFIFLASLVFASATILPLRFSGKKNVEACTPTSCSSFETCCETPMGPGCCPDANACCCPDQAHCCGSPYKCQCSGQCPGAGCVCTTCTNSGGACENASVMKF